MIGISKKSTVEASLYKALETFSESYYGEDEHGRLTAFFSLVDDLRRDIGLSLPYRQSLTVHEEYLQALELLEDRFPFGEDNVSVNVKTTWFNHLAKKISQAGWLSSGGTKSDSTTMTSIPFEQACVVFNIGALTATEAHRSEETKASIQLFQRAAAIFHITRDQLVQQVSASMTCDMSMSGLNMCSSICLAYAQQRFYTQAVKDALPATLLAKLANQVAEFYDAAVTCTKQMEGAISPEYREQFTGTTGLFRARAEFHQAIAQKVACEKEMAGFGACVQRHRTALELANLAKIAFEDKDERTEVETLLAEIQASLHPVESDNDNVYMELVPAANTLPAIGKVATVKVQPDLTLQDLYGSDKEVAKYEDLIDCLLPEEVGEFVQDFNIRIESLVAAIDDEARAQTKEIEETMHDYNLPFCLDAHTDNNLPEGTWQKILEVQTRGGVAALQTQLNHVGEIDRVVRSTIQEIRTKLTEEEQGDADMNKRFMTRWARLPSSNTNRTFFNHLKQTEDQLRQVQDTLPQLMSNVQTVHIVAKLLDKTQGEIVETLPPPVDIPQDSCQIVSVRSALDKLLKETSDASSVADKCKAEILEFAIEGHLLHAHQSGYSMDRVIDDKVDELTAYRTKASEKLGKLQNYLASLRTAFDRYQRTREGTANPRVKALSDLDNKAQTMLQTFSDIQERINYYNRIQGYLTSVQKQVGEYVFARNEEKATMLGNITREIANPGSAFHGVVIEEFPLGSLGVKISYEQGTGWRVTEVTPNGEVAKKGSLSRIHTGAVLICIDDYDLRNEPNVSAVLDNPRGNTRKVVFIPPQVAQGQPPPIMGGVGFPSATAPSMY
eukprot:GEMP01005495.1.p1 GENE.GEMP01005495.1~~GEMP01005495.1.p1  ORF type:complete len:840 (+),score=237.62 GEMP01005495.1:266-2785(+)